MNTDTIPLPETMARLRHDLRNPVGQVIGYAEMLIEDAQAGVYEGLAADLERIRDAGRRVVSIIDERMTNEAFAGSPSPPSPATAEVFSDNRAPLSSTVLSIDSYLSLNDQERSRVGDDAEDEEQTPKGRILIVDDVEDNRDLLARRLERDGHQVVMAESGQEALSLLETGLFDLVLLDIMMPGLDGYATLANLKSRKLLRRIPVIMISALDEMDSVVRCIELGAADYLAKPFSPVLLRARVGACLREKKGRDREAYLYSEVQINYRRLQQLEKMRDDLTHMIVHDLRTPLTSVITGLQTLEVLGEMNEGQAEMLQLSLQGGQTLLGMINDLLDIGKMEDGSMQLEYTTLSASGLAHRALEQVQLLARDKSLQLTAHLPENLPTFRGDEDKLRRTLVNLLGNAFKFTPRGGQVTLSIRENEAGDSLVFAVQDTGEGIPKEGFERIFEKFGQIEDRKEGRKMSTGLGLTFCRMAVEAHHGRIWVESELGVGSIFSFLIPLKADK